MKIFMVDQKIKRARFWIFLFDWIGVSCLIAFLGLMGIDLVILIKRVFPC
jgi:hypothetical protein